MGESSLELPVDHVVGLVGVDAAFGVAEQDVGAADAGEHGGRGLSGVGTLVEPVHGLGAGGDVGAFDGLDDVGERGHGGEEGDVLIVVVVDQGKELLEKGERLLGSLVHLPVGGNQRFTHQEIQYSILRHGLGSVAVWAGGSGRLTTFAAGLRGVPG